MPQPRPRRAIAASAFVGGVLSAGASTALLEVAIDNADWLPLRIAATLGAAAAAASGAGHVARRAAERARDARDARAPEGRRGDQHDAVPLAVETTRDLPANQGPAAPGDTGHYRSGRVRYAVLDERTSPYSTHAQVDVRDDELLELARYRVGVGEIDAGDRGISLRGSGDYPNSPAAPAVPAARRFAGVARVRTAVATPLIAFALGFAGGGVAVHHLMPDTSGLAGAVQDAFSSNPDRDEASGDAELALRQALEDAEERSPGASGRLTYLMIDLESTVSLSYYEPDSGREISIYDGGDPSVGGDVNSSDTFALDVDALPPLNTMREEAFAYFAQPYYIDIGLPDDDLLLPPSHVDGAPIVTFLDRDPYDEYDEIQATLDGQLAPTFDTTDIATAQSTLLKVLNGAGLDPGASAYESFGGSGPKGSVGYASGMSAPGHVLYATLGPGAGDLPPGELAVASGQFPVFDPDDHQWTPEEVAALIPADSLSPDVLTSVFDEQSAAQGAETADLRSYVYRVDAPTADDPALLTLTFLMLEDSALKYGLDGAPY